MRRRVLKIGLRRCVHDQLAVLTVQLFSYSVLSGGSARSLHQTFHKPSKTFLGSVGEALIVPLL